MNSEKQIIKQFQVQVANNQAIHPTVQGYRECYRFQTQEDEENPFVGGDRPRSELQLIPTAREQLNEWWRYTVSVWIPKDFNTKKFNTNGTHITEMGFVQWHGQTIGVPLQALIRDDEIVWRMQILDEFGVYRSLLIPQGTPRLLIKFDEWMDWTIDVVWSQTTQGHIRIWANERMLTDYTGITNPQETTAPYFKIGLQRKYFIDGMREFEARIHKVYIGNFSMEKFI